MVLLVGIVSFLIFLSFQALGVFTGDSGDLVTAALVHGVPHPPGYPLYTLLGYLSSLIPLFTPSWRVTLLSSISHAMVVVMVFLIVERITKKPLAGIFASVILLGNYLFFLYSVTPEVFALFDLFVMVLLYQLILYGQKPSMQLLTCIVFTFGLSLTHHHVILFTVPALFYGVFAAGLPKNFSLKNGMFLFVVFVLGLLPYIYAPIAGQSDAIINWDKPTTISRFIQLVSRQDYGSFVSGGVFGHTMAERLISIKAYATFIFLDFRIVGVILSIIGFIAWFAHDRRIAKAVLLVLFLLGPFFFFYASFPIISRFTLGTYERFLLPSYCVYAVLIGIGFGAVTDRVADMLKKRGAGKALIAIVFSGILFLYPLTIMSVTLYRFIGLRTDKTADNLGEDVLSSAPENAILLLSQDTLLFTTQYVRYGLNVRSDTIVIHASRLTATDYQDVLKNKFPDLVFPTIVAPTYVGDFIRANSARHRVFTNAITSAGQGWYFIPHGLLYEVVSSDALVPFDQMREENAALFAGYRDPTTGLLSRYKHLMLSDVLDVYAWAHINYGKTLIRATAYEDAIKAFQSAVSLDGDSSKADAYTYLGATYAITGKCTEAIEALGRAKDASHAVKPEQILYESLTYRDCIKDATRAATLFSEYERLRSTGETLLQSL